MLTSYRAGLSVLQRCRPDRRQAPRFRVELFVEWDHGMGITHDVSVGGVFFVTQQAGSLGDPIQGTLAFDHLDLGHSVRLHFRGQVVRVEQYDGHTGVAVAVTAYRAETPEESGAATSTRVHKKALC